MNDSAHGLFDGYYQDYILTKSYYNIITLIKKRNFKKNFKEDNIILLYSITGKK